MTVYLHVPNELHCDEVGITMSRQASCLTHKTSDGLALGFRTQNTVDEQVFQPSKRISQRFLRTFDLWTACIFLLQAFLFRCVYIVFSALDFGIRFFFFLLLLVFADVCYAIHCGMICIGLYDHQPSEDVLETHQAASLVDTICTPSPYKLLSQVDGV